MEKMNKTLLGVVLIIIAVGAFFYFKSPRTPETMNNNQNNQTNESGEVIVPDSVVAAVETSLGNFEVTLDGKAAPQTVANFMKLANEGFYDGLTFHRIMKEPGFHLIQGGDPRGDGSGGPGYTVPAEFGLKHSKGAIAMARLPDHLNPNKDSSGSQFYIVTEDIAFLDGNYTVFGYVTSGMDVVEKIVQVATDTTYIQTDAGLVKQGNDKPLTPVIIKKITIKE